MLFRGFAQLCFPQDRKRCAKVAVAAASASGLLAAFAHASSATCIRLDGTNGSGRVFGDCVAARLGKVREAEKRILALMSGTSFEALDVPVPLDAGRRCFLEKPKTEYSIRTIIVGKEHRGKLPIVLIHGYMMGAPAFFKLLPLLAAERTVYAIDIIGMGGSERPPFDASNITAEEAEDLLTHPFERWAEAMKLSEFVLAGHSFGGFVASCWATRSPDSVKALFLLSPLLGWSNKRISQIEERVGDSIWAALIDAAWANHITPHSLVRRVPGFKSWLARSNERRFQGMASNVTTEEGRLMSEYVVASMDMPSSTERAATVCFEKWLRPVSTTSGTIKQRVARLTLPVCAIYGDRDWMEPASRDELPQCKFIVLRDSGHHLYWDNPVELADQILSEIQEVSYNGS